MNKTIYREIINRLNLNISATEVKHEMQNAIEEAAKLGNIELLEIPREGEIPTIEEFVTFVVKQLN